MNEHIGPSVWHGREVNSCTRCVYLKCHLVKSGRRPDYEYFCRHPDILSGQYTAEKHRALLDKVKEKYPDKYAAFAASVARHDEATATNGEFISNDEVTPETPPWCPVLKRPDTKLKEPEFLRKSAESAGE